MCMQVAFWIVKYNKVNKNNKGKDMTKIGKKRELKSEIIAFRVTASFKEKLQEMAQADKRELNDFIRLKLEECVPASMPVGQ